MLGVRVTAPHDEQMFRETLDDWGGFGDERSRAPGSHEPVTERYPGAAALARRARALLDECVGR
jgi:hypothetical protein